MIKIDINDESSSKLYLALLIFRELNRGGVDYKSTKDICKRLGLSPDWINDRVRFIKKNHSNLEMDFLGDFMNEYAKHFNLDIDNSEDWNSLFSLFMNKYSPENLEYVDKFIIENYTPKDFEELLETSKKILSYDIKVFPKEAIENFKVADAFKVTDLTKAVAEKSIAGDIISEYIKEIGVKANVTKASVWDSGENKNVSVKFDYRKSSNLDDSAFEGIFDKFLDKLKEDRYKKHGDTHSIAKINGDGVGVICIHDAHFGKIALKSVSNDVYNLDIAKKRWMEAIVFHVDMFERNGGVGEVKLIVGNDLFNTDNGKTTTAGTPQDEQTLYEQTFDFVTEVLIDSCEYIVNKFPLEVVTVAGNHDKMSVLMIAKVLKAYYRFQSDTKYDIVVNGDGLENQLRRYICFGDTALCFTHGDKEKRKDIVRIMDYELEELYPTKRFKRKEVIVGHFHQEKQRDDLEAFGNTTFRVMPSISGTDRWHYEMGYIGRKSSASLVYGKDYVLYNKKDVCK